MRYGANAEKGDRNREMASSTGQVLNIIHLRGSWQTDQGRKADNMAETEGYGFDGKMHIIRVQMGYPNRIAFSNEVLLIAKK